MTESRLTPVEVLHRYADVYKGESDRINKLYHGVTTGLSIGGAVLIFINPSLTILLGLAGISTWTVRKHTLRAIDNVLIPLMTEDLLEALRVQGDQDQGNQMGSRPPGPPIPPGSISPVPAPIRPPLTGEGALAKEPVEARVPV